MRYSVGRLLTQRWSVLPRRAWGGTIWRHMKLLLFLSGSQVWSWQ